MKRFHLAICLLFSPFWLLAQEDAPTLSATETDKLLESEDQELVVTGFIESTGRSASGIHFLNFRDSEFKCVVFPQHAAAFTEGSPSEIYLEKQVEIHGTVELFRGKPQIKLESPDQVVVHAAPDKPEMVEAPEMEPEPEKTAEVTEPEPENVAAKPQGTDQPVEGSSLAVETELIDGQLPVDWRTFFPTAAPPAGAAN